MFSFNSWGRWVLGTMWLAAGWACHAAGPGMLDTNYVPVLDNAVRAIALAGEGKVYVGGHFTQVNGAASPRLVRLNTDGSTDLGFSIGNSFSNGWVSCLALQEDGKLLVGGSFTNVQGLAHTNLTRLNPDGSVDLSFNTGRLYDDTYFSRPVSSLLVQPDGKIVYGTDRLGRLNADGSADSGFAKVSLFGDGYWSIFGSDYYPATVDNLVRLPNGSLLFQGFFSSSGKYAYDGLAVATASGVLDTNFLNFGRPTYKIATPVGGLAATGAMAVQPDGQILVGCGHSAFSDSVAGFPLRRVVRLDAQGRLQADFQVDIPQNFTYPSNKINLIKALANGRILVSGYFNTVNLVPRKNLVCLLPSGEIDPDFDATAQFDRPLLALTELPDGSFLMGGGFTQACGQERSYLVRILGFQHTNEPPVAPVISQQPQATTVLAGKRAHLAVAASGSPLQYQWLHEGVAVPGATNALLAFTNTQVSDAGGYQVVVSAGSGLNATSQVATVKVVTLNEALQATNMNLSCGLRYYNLATHLGPTDFSRGWTYSTNLSGLKKEGIKMENQDQGSGPAPDEPRAVLFITVNGPGVLTADYRWSNGDDLNLFTYLYFTVQIGTNLMQSVVSDYFINWSVPAGEQVVALEFPASSGWSTSISRLVFETQLSAFKPGGARYTAQDGFRCPLELTPTVQPFHVEYSTDLRSWYPFTHVTNLSSPFLLADPDAADGCRFYRVVK